MLRCVAMYINSLILLSEEEMMSVSKAEALLSTVGPLLQRIVSGLRSLSCSSETIAVRCVCKLAFRLLVARPVAPDLLILSLTCTQVLSLSVCALLASHDSL